MVKKHKDDRSGIFVPAGIFFGLGFGMLTGNVAAGLFIGMGLGFTAMAISRHKN